MKIDDVRIDRDDDARYVLTEAEEEQLREDVLVTNSNMSIRKLAEKWEVSSTKIWTIRNPEQHKKNTETRKLKYRGKYYDTKKASARTAKCRAKKKIIRENIGDK